MKGENNTKNNFLGLNSLIRPFPHLNTFLTARCHPGTIPTQITEIHGSFPSQSLHCTGPEVGQLILVFSRHQSWDMILPPFTPHLILPRHTTLWAFLAGNLTPALGHSLEIFAPFSDLAPQQGDTVFGRAGLLTHIPN